LDPYLTKYRSNIGVQLKEVTEQYMHTLDGIKSMNVDSKSPGANISIFGDCHTSLEENYKSITMVDFAKFQ